MKPRTKTKYRRTSDGKLFKVVKLHGVEGFVVRFTSNCSGCSEDGEHQPSDRGCGCEECGYTGKRRQEHWVPFDFEQAERMFAKVRHNKAQFVLDIEKRARTQEREKLVSDLRLEADELDKNADAILEFGGMEQESRARHMCAQHLRGFASVFLLEKHLDKMNELRAEVDQLVAAASAKKAIGS